MMVIKETLNPLLDGNECFVNGHFCTSDKSLDDHRMMMVFSLLKCFCLSLNVHTQIKITCMV